MLSKLIVTFKTNYLKLSRQKNYVDFKNLKDLKQNVKGKKLSV